MRVRGRRDEDRVDRLAEVCYVTTAVLLVVAIFCLFFSMEAH